MLVGRCPSKLSGHEPYAKSIKSQALSGAPHGVCRVTQCLLRCVEEPVPSVAEGTSAVLILPMLLGAFQKSEPILRVLP